MITIYAEKPDVGNKIAAALDKITLKSGAVVNFENLKTNEKAVKSQQFKDGYLEIMYKGEPCYVTWGYGHLCELKQAADYNPDYKNWRNLPIPFIPEKYEIKVKDEVKKQFDLVKRLFNKSSLVINATDYDREGELIFYYLKEAAGYKGVFKRAYFTSQTKEGIQEGFEELRAEAEVKNMTNAGRARSIADLDIGANMTVCMSLKYPGTGVLSIGRVQTPTLNMLVERELAIRNFKASPYYTITAEFTTLAGEKFRASHKKKSFEKKEEAEAVLRKVHGKNGQVKNIEKKTLYKQTPNLYNLSTLQMEANSRYGFTLAKTLQLAQELYEGGYTTYPRTDSQFLTSDMEKTVTNTLNLLEKNPAYEKYINGKAKKYNKRYFDDSKVSSHFAIIPTGQLATGLSGDQAKLYDLIAKSIIMMLYDSAELERTHIVIDVSREEFIANGTVIKNPGWMVVDAPAKEELLPMLSVGDLVGGRYSLDEKMTEPPKRYTDKTLVAAMISAGKDLDDENLRNIMASGIKGIGTEATRAGIIETLINREYAVRDKKSIAATDKGIALIQALPLNEIKSAELTAKWEDRLNKIANGEENFDVFVKDIEKLTKDWCNVIKTSTSTVEIRKESETEFKCPLCGKPLVKYAWGYGCRGYKDGCRFSLGNKVAGKKLTEKQIGTLLAGKQTSNIKGFKSKAGKEFSAALQLKDGKLEFVKK